MALRRDDAVAAPPTPPAGEQGNVALSTAALHGRRYRWPLWSRQARTVAVPGSTLPPTKRSRWRAALDRPVVTRRTSATVAGAQRWQAGDTTLADIILPDAIGEHTLTEVEVGDSWLTTLTVRTLPARLEFGWLDHPDLALDDPGITVHQLIEPVPDMLARKLLERSETAAARTATDDEASGASIDMVADEGGQAATALRRDVVSGNDRLMRLTVTITVAGATRDELRTRVDELRTQAAQLGITLVPARLAQWDGYIAAQPVASVPNMPVHDVSGHVAKLSMPTRPVGLDPRGGRTVYWGVHPDTYAPILWDMLRGTNPHGLCIGESGGGKSYLIKGLISQEVARGDVTCVIVDPKDQEYRELVESLNGTYVTLSPTAEAHINPLALPALSSDRQREVLELNEDLLTQRIGFNKALIVQELRATGTAIEGIGMAQIEEAIAAAYAERGITNDPATFNHEMPTYSDVQRCLEQLGMLEDDEDAKRLARAMLHWTRGTLGSLFNHTSNIEVRSPVLAIDVWPLLNSQDEVLQRVVPVIVMDFLVSVAINRPLRPRTMLFFDEGHALLMSEAGQRTLGTIYRIGRSLGFSALVITQMINDLVKSDYTRVLLDNSQTKILMGVNPTSDAADRVASLLQLNDEEAAWYRGCRFDPAVGSTGLLLAGEQRTKLLVPPWPATMHYLITGEEQTT